MNTDDNKVGIFRFVDVSEDAQQEVGIDSVPGMGRGASSSAKRWAFLGYKVEEAMFIRNAVKKPRGRPRKKPEQSKDAWKAYVVWSFVHHLNHPSLRRATNRKLIDFVRQAEAKLDVPMLERAFPDGGNFEASLSRGKRALKIDSRWNSRLCEKVHKI